MSKCIRTNQAFGGAGRVICALLVAVSTLSAADWRQFRGTSTDSVAVGEALPTELSGDVINWQIDLPGRGLSGPIVVEDQVVITASSGYHDDRLHVMSLDVSTGEQLWERRIITCCHCL